MAVLWFEAWAGKDLLSLLTPAVVALPMHGRGKLGKVQLGLRISSNPEEYANDVMVSHRQKYQGMSWSATGSTSLATLSSVGLNSQQSNWLTHHEITFTF